MKIGLVLSSTSAYSETFFYYKIRGLRAKGFTVVLFVNNLEKNLLDDTIIVKRAPKLYGNHFKLFFISIFSLLKVLVFNFKATKSFYKLEQADKIAFIQRLKNIISNAHILTESLDWLHFGFGTLALGRENVAKAIGAKMAVSFRGFDIGIYPLKFPQCYYRVWDKVDKIHVISNDLHDLLFKNGFDGETPVVKITPAIDTSFFNRESKQVLLNNPVRILTVARLHWKKGLEYTLEALSKLKPSGISFRYLIIGEGEEYERLKYAVHQLDLEKEVGFLGKRSHEEIKHQMQLSDIYIQYSLQEGFCNSVLEAQAMGLLCLVSDAEGLGENIINQKTGWVLPKRSPEKLATKLTEVIGLSEFERNKIRKQARNHVLENFTLEDQNHSFYTFYVQ